MIGDQELRKRIRRAAFEAGTQKGYALALGVNPSVLSAFMTGERPPSKRLLAAVGYERVEIVRYRRVRP